MTMIDVSAGHESHSDAPQDEIIDLTQKTRLVFGRGALSRLGELVAEFGVSRVLMVTDHGLRDAGHADRGAAILRDAGMQVALYDDVHENPTSTDVNRCVEFARQHGVELIVGLGGGSSLDCAKGCNFVLTNGGQISDYRGVGRARKPMLPMIGVPTTAGTGSEAQSFAVISDDNSHLKMACGDPKAACRIAVLDPELTVTMPRAVAAATGIDAMTHAIESYVTTRRNPVSQMYSAQAWRLLARAFPRVLAEPDDVVTRGEMQLGAFLAGSAIECSMLGAAHAAANPLSAHFDTVHGVAVGLLLPHVIRWNAVTVGEMYHELAVAAGWSEPRSAGGSSAERLAEGFEGLLRLAGVPTSLSAAIEDAPDDHMLETLADEASRQWTGTFNPRRMDATAFLALYRNAR